MADYLLAYTSRARHLYYQSALFPTEACNRKVENRLPCQRYATTSSTVVPLTSTSASSVGMWFGSPAHLLVALRLRLCAVYAGNWHSLRRLHAWTDRSRTRREALGAGCVTVREATLLVLWERRYYVSGKTWGPVRRRSRWLGDFGRLEALSG